MNCIICDKPAAHVCAKGNTLCAGCARKIRKSKISVSLGLPDESAAGADSSPGSLAPAAPKSNFARM